MKGGAGRVATIGGSLEYTGAPYFAAAAALRAGVDLSHVFCDRTAGGPIKSYSPELIVHPLLASASPGDEAPEASHAARVEAGVGAVGPWVPRCDAFLVGPGLGRDPAVMEATARLVVEIIACNRRVVLDADGLFILSSALAATPRTPSQEALVAAIKSSPERVIVTPNKVEFERLCSAVGIAGGERGGDAFARAETLAAQVARGIGANVLMIVKGPRDVISDGTETISCGAEGSPRRAGGQGDVLAGLTLAFQLWSQREGNAGLAEREAKGSWCSGRRLDLACAFAACEVARGCARTAFAKHRRAMLANDLLAEVGPTFHEMFPPEESAE